MSLDDARYRHELEADPALVGRVLGELLWVPQAKDGRAPLEELLSGKLQ
jgi:hypothetical protein